MGRYFFPLVLGVWGLLHFYVAARLVPDLGLSSVGSVLCWSYLGMSALLAPLPLWLRLSRLPDRSASVAAWTGYLAMGVFSTLAVLTLLRDVVSLVVWIATSTLSGGSGIVWTTWAQRSARAVLVLTLGLTLLGLWNARRTPRVRELCIPFPALPETLVGFTIVQLSDIHVGPTIRRGFVERVVRRVNTLDADVVAITGDLIDAPLAFREADIAPLSGLQARHGTFCVTGNHEYYHGVDNWIAAWRRCGMTILLNEHRVLRHAGARLLLAGVTDFSAFPFGASHRSDPARAMRVGANAPGFPSDAPSDTGAIGLRVLLAHQPRSAPAALAAGFDLQLSGHTHGGQFWPWMLFVPLQQPFVAGLKRLGRMWVYVSRGTGYWGPPLRVGAPSEITRIRLVRG